MNSIKIVKKRGNYDLYLTFFSKKVEKIVSAVYLITEHFSKDESLKWQLRKKGLQLLSDTMSLSKTNLSRRDKVLSNIERTILEVISLLEVSLVAKTITVMNNDIFKRELNLLIDFINNNLNEIEQKNPSFLKEDFFKVKGGDLQSKNVFNRKGLLDKGHNKGHFISSKQSFGTEITNKIKGQNISNLEKRQTRRGQILKLFNKGQKLTIKDISQVIDNCGEKTIQREIQSMMKEGLIKKEGERRWSRYSLK